jgi:hypothetical protein
MGVHVMTYEQDPTLRHWNEESSALAWKLGIAAAIGMFIMIVFQL